MFSTQNTEDWSNKKSSVRTDTTSIPVPQTKHTLSTKKLANEGRPLEDLSELNDFSTVIQLHYAKEMLLPVK